MPKTALRRILTVGAVLTAATALGAAPAHAAPTTGAVKLAGQSLTFTAGPGATNKITMAGTLDHYFYFIDERNDVTIDASAADKCVQVTTKSVRCIGITFATFGLADGADSFYTEGYIPVLVKGGPGNDSLTAKTSDVPVYLYGQDGNDRLAGGNGDDLLDAGPGVLQSTAGGSGTDICRGSGVIKSSCEKL